MATAIIEDEDSAIGWVQFCDKEAKSVALEFSKAWKLYLSTNEHNNLEKKELIDKFIEQLSSYLETYFSNDDFKVQNGSTISARSASADDILEAASDEGPDSPSLKIVHKPFFRRLSFKGLKKGKGLFLKQHSDEVELSPHHEKFSSRTERRKPKSVKLNAQIIREGNVHLLLNETQESSSQWVKCRMALLKVSAGYMIEFYTPPKVSI